MTPLLLALALASVAAAHDLRRSTIPDWITLPPLLAAPVVGLFAAGWAGAAASVLGAAASAAGPLLLYRRRALGGGDVKLFAALGALLGWTLGLELELLALVAVSAVALARAARAGELGVLLRGAAAIYTRAGRTSPERRPTRAVRFAPYIALGASIVTALELSAPWGP